MIELLEGFALAGVLPIVALIFIYKLEIEFLNLNAMPMSIVVFFTAGWLLLVWIVISITLNNYYLDRIIVTNKRVIDIDQVGLFSMDLATITKDKIQDVKVEVKGIIPTLLKYGTIHIQSAGANREIVIEGVHHPEKIKEAIIGNKFQA
jgi:uncharacterized membrane protein YdbT with pleckstrin-like domain